MAGLDDDVPKKQWVCLVTDFDKDKIANGFQNIQVVEALVPVPGNGQYLVRMRLRPIDPTDLIAASGGYGEELHKLPFVNGTEGVGEIAATGPGGNYKFKVGQRVVAGDWIDGTWQEYVVVDEDVLLGVPDSLDDCAASQFLVNPCTIIEYSKHLGIKTINQVHRNKYAQELKDLGADEVINTEKEDLAQRVKEITGGAGAHSAIDPVSGTTTGKVVESVRKGGKTFVYGVLADDKVVVRTMDLLLYKVNQKDVLQCSRTLAPFILYVWLPSGGRAKMQERMQRTMDLLVKGVFKTAPTDKVFPLKDVHAAIAEHQKPGHGGRKVFLK